jgi:hypothetical protein
MGKPVVLYSVLLTQGLAQSCAMTSLFFEMSRFVYPRLRDAWGAAWGVADSSDHQQPLDKRMHMSRHTCVAAVLCILPFSVAVLCSGLALHLGLVGLFGHEEEQVSPCLQAQHLTEALHAFVK